MKKIRPPQASSLTRQIDGHWEEIPQQLSEVFLRDYILFRKKSRKWLKESRSRGLHVQSARTTLENQIPKSRLRYHYLEKIGEC